LVTGWSRPRSYQPSTKFIAPSQLRRMRGCEQVAAVCYRARGSSIEFLLVQTRGGRWTFPKGSTEPGLTHAQAAALEAFEEAGVHGRMEEASFTRYARRKRGSSSDPATPEIAVNAHLCEVLWLGPPQEADRNPTWFTADKAKRRLLQDRAPDYGAELARVVDHALGWIQRFRSGASAVDALQKVHFTIENAREITGRTRAAAISRKHR
jgi:8-oxo-dGTP pyrophosphatase MutT (NUDIX family)